MFLCGRFLFKICIAERNYLTKKCYEHNKKKKIVHLNVYVPTPNQSVNYQKIYIIDVNNSEISSVLCICEATMRWNMPIYPTNKS